MCRSRTRLEVADGEPRRLAEAAEDGRRRLQGEAVVEPDRDGLTFEQRVAYDCFPGEPRMIEKGAHAQRQQFMLVRQVVGGCGEQEVQAHVERAGVAHDLGLALLVRDLFFQVPVLVGANLERGPQVVEVEHEAGRVLLQELRGRRREVRFRLALCRRELGPEHSEQALADVADDLVLGHERQSGALLGEGSPEGLAQLRGLAHFEEIRAGVK
jgi:hypothetical protein